MNKLLLSSIVALVGAVFIQVDARCSEEVTVTYADGKSDKGELIDQTPDKIILRVKVGGNRMDLPLSWSRIQSVSNGLTQETALNKWKEQHAGKLCAECNGDRKIACKRCGGLGVLARALIVCTACKGAGTAPCPAKDCDKGQVPCTEKCLKLSEGQWVKGKEDLLWRRFTYKGGWVEYSQRHLGDIIEMKDGVPTDVGKCPLCHGTMKLACKICSGTGTAPCALCKGAKQIPAPGAEKKCPDCKGAKAVQCPTCKGTGLKP